MLTILPDKHNLNSASILFLLTSLFSLSYTTDSFSSQYNGFLIVNPLIPLSEIRHGGPPKDGIPSINNPVFVSASQATYLNDNDRILGIRQGKIFKAYPVRILNWHEIINDEDTVISYCPLCGTGMAFESGGSRFGVSGLLYNSDMLLYDHGTNSLWSQIIARAISGEKKGQYLKMLPLEHTSWADWRDRHPDTQVLSDKTGYSRNYSRSPYGNYATSESLYFPVIKQDQRYHPKEQVIGLKIGQKYKAYPFTELAKTNKLTIQDTVNGTTVIIQFNAQHRSGNVFYSSGKEIPTVTSYWFAWYAFHPDTEVYQYSLE